MIVAYLIAAAVLLVLDFLWLGFVAKDLYRREIGDLLADPFNIPAALAFYALYILGLMIFVIAPALSGEGWQRAALYGALFGFFAYATYDMTNLATLKGYTAKLAFLDMAWGSFVSAAASSVSVVLTRLFISQA